MGFLEERREERDFMSRYHIAARGIRDRRVLKAMRQIPRHIFVPLSSSELMTIVRSRWVGSEHFSALYRRVHAEALQLRR